MGMSVFIDVKINNFLLPAENLDTAKEFVDLFGTSSG
jgi:hypothetical protein